MAGGKQSPRQKMINLMYLVFISMLALNMSKEVLNAFGLLNVNIEENIKSVAAKNELAMSDLNQLAIDQPDQYRDAKAKGVKVNELSSKYYSYLEELKTQMEGTVEDPSDYAVMDKGDFLDVKFLKGGVITDEGQEFLDQMTNYRDGIKDAVPNNQELARDLDKKFTPSEVETQGVTMSYLDYNYKGYPLIASIAKLTLLQSEVKNTETRVLSTLMNKELKAAGSVTKLTTLMEQPKSAYYNGETFDGNIVLGKKDPSFKPERVELTLDGRKLVQDKDFEILDGRIALKVGAGSPGDHKIKGQIIFLEDGEEKPIEVDQSFATIPKPNSAIIAADKMNVVYRGVSNPMTISFAGVSGNNVNASAPGLTRKSGDSYVMSPGAGTSVKINVTGKLSTGETVSDSKEFRIKNLPRPTGMVSKEYENIRKTRANLGISTVSVEFLDFDFDLSPKVTGFLFMVPGQPSINVSGNKLNAAAKDLLSRARRGDLVQIANIKADVPGILLQNPSSVVIEITD